MSSIIKVDTVQDQDGNNIINENANTITIGASGDTITIPSGATLANNGTATGFASIAWQSSIVTAATLTAEAGKGYWINTTSNACTITLPASASVGDQIIFTDYARNWGTNAITINQNSLNFQGATTPNPIYNTDGQSVDLVYSGATKGWIPNSDDDVTLETAQPYSADFLVIAGGGSGGVHNGAAGGAGGLRTSFGPNSGGGASAETNISLVENTVYTITIGAGGAGQTSDSSVGIAGVNSSLSGSGITTITSIGGGYGGSAEAAAGGGAGGSGGGATVNYSAGAGTSNQGYAGGGSNSDQDLGGGGGAAAVGQAGSSGNYGGAGGAGLQVNIDGNNYYWSGGGGGAAYGPGEPAGAGGIGGGGGGSGGNGSTGGAGGSSALNSGGTGDSGAQGGESGGSGGANTGSGGGGKSRGLPGASGAGGSGIVILSMPDASYSGTTTGSPTVATGVSGKTVLTFTGSGSYTG